ncbi:T9SS type A sorting domain-containing protein [Aquimarina sp. ERC-38]|uniref:type IX secretion system anionic LPS delivery protein PorZ n=1 Tax=Aquimarina sp. ERC-38 TaxID=2949996 RepID=UPI00224715B0|nr:two-component regulator propeller domain-containing protein [Aquimarina sp. ERC-38]UZO82048.1 T9SS type A sorting domain-containing protein [Aquimarina sp. ERC-38]
MNTKHYCAMKFFYTFLFFLFSFWCSAQDFSAQWIDHYSYFSIKDLHISENKVYAATDNALFIFDNETNTSQRFSTIQGLSGSDITTVYHSSAFNITAIGYQNGFLEFITPDQKVRTFVDIFDKATIPPDDKKINSFYESGNELLIATGFGIVSFNLENIEFGDTFFIGAGGSQIDVSATTIVNNTIYASTVNGLLTAPANDSNLIDFNRWSVANPSVFRGIIDAGDNLIVWSSAGVFRVQGNTTVPILTIPNVISVTSSNNQLTLITPNTSIILDQNFKEVTRVVSNDTNTFIATAASTLDNTLFLGTSELGLLKIPINNIMQREVISPSGPLHNDPFSVSVLDNNAWVVYGRYDLFFNPFPKVNKGISRFNNGEWQNISRDDILGFSSLTRVAINPNNPEQVFVTSFSDGLLEVRNNEVVASYDPANSDIDNFDLAGENVAWLNGPVFDDAGNLWFNNSRVDLPLNRLNLETNEVTTFNSITGLLPDFSDGYTDTVIDDEGNVYFAGGTIGIIGFNPNTEATVTIDEENGLPSDYVSTLAIDRDDQMWIGTFLGLRVLSDPSEALNNGNLNLDRIVIEDDEGVGQELLFDITITDIEVDGSNNKWVATSSSGAFYFSPDGQETIAQFTTDNSPLPSDNILDIAVDDSTGIVYFATEKGLIALKGTATGPEDNLTEVIAFPNPVRPQYDGNVTIRGLTEDSNVKITDIEGNLVFEETSEGGSLQWDTRAFGRHKVASGVYLILVTGNDSGETTVFKLLIVR